MSQSVQDAMKTWAAPFLLTITLALCSVLWMEQRDRIAALEKQAALAAAALTTVTTNQETSRDDREAFQEGTAKRLDQMAEVLTKLNDAVVRLTTLQERAAP